MRSHRRRQGKAASAAALTSAFAAFRLSVEKLAHSTQRLITASPRRSDLHYLAETAQEEQVWRLRQMIRFLTDGAIPFTHSRS